MKKSEDEAPIPKLILKIAKIGSFYVVSAGCLFGVSFLPFVENFMRETSDIFLKVWRLLFLTIFAITGLLSGTGLPQALKKIKDSNANPTGTT